MKRSATFSVKRHTLNPGTDLFSEPPVDVSVVSGDYEKFAPQHAIDDSVLIRFNIASSSGGYLDLNDSFLHSPSI